MRTTILIICLVVLAGCSGHRKAQQQEWIPSFSECPECYEGCNRHGSSVSCTDEYGDEHRNVRSDMYW